MGEKQPRNGSGKITVPSGAVSPSALHGGRWDLFSFVAARDRPPVMPTVTMGTITPHRIAKDRPQKERPVGFPSVMSVPPHGRTMLTPHLPGAALKLWFPEAPWPIH